MKIQDLASGQSHAGLMILASLAEEVRERLNLRASWVRLQTRKVVVNAK